MNVAIGDIVYPVYKPAQVGRIISINDANPLLPRVTILTRRGKEVTTNVFRSYPELVDEHRRKYLRHAAILAEFD